MSRLFLRAFNQSATVDASPVSAFPFCMGVWFRINGGSNDQTLMYYGDASQGNGAYSRLAVTKLQKVWADSAHTGNFVVSAASFSDDAWHACLLVERDTGDRILDLYVDGVLIGFDQSPNPGAPSLLERVSLGRAMSPTPFDSLQGTLAEGFIAAVQPTADQVAAWSRGASPRYVFGNAIKGYWPLWGVHSPEIDVSGLRNDLVLVGTSRNTHAPVSTYTPRWASFSGGGGATARRVCLDGVVMEVAA